MPCALRVTPGYLLQTAPSAALPPATAYLLMNGRCPGRGRAVRPSVSFRALPAEDLGLVTSARPLTKSLAGWGGGAGPGEAAHPLAEVSGVLGGRQGLVLPEPQPASPHPDTHARQDTEP